MRRWLRDPRGRFWRRWTPVGLFLTVSLGLAGSGCRGVPTPSEARARAELQRVEAHWQEDRTHGPTAVLSPAASLSDLVRFGVRNHPSVRAAYSEWAAAVERITVRRSLPDPRLSFESDVADVIMTVMPGFMQELPGPGKLRAAAAVASAESQAKYFAFERSVLQTAFEVQRTYFEGWFLEERLRLLRRSLAVVDALEATARAQNVTGRTPLGAIYRTQTERDRLRTEIANLEDLRIAWRAQIKGALGLGPEATDPPLPAHFESTPLEVDGERLLQIAFARNPRLRQMEAEVRMAEADLALAAKARVPDFSLGLMADLKAVPVMFRPLAGMSLPVWRDKIAAEIARAQAQKAAAQARLNTEQIRLAVEVAVKTFEYRQSTRNLALLRDRLLPAAWQTLESTRAEFLVGQDNLVEVLEAERAWLELGIQEAEARIRREVLRAELSLLIAGVPPPGAEGLLSPAESEAPQTSMQTATWAAGTGASSEARPASAARLRQRSAP